MDLYLYLEPEAAALDTSLVGVWFNSEHPQLQQWLTKQPLIKSLEDLDRVVEVLDKLEEMGELVYHHLFIPVSDINRVGRERGCYIHVEIMIPEMILKLRQKPSHIYKTKDCPSSVYYPITPLGGKEKEGKKLGFWLGEVISLAQRRWFAQTIAHKECPLFNWDQNLGFDTKEHRQLCLKYGINCELHYKDFLANLPFAYLEELQEFNPDFYFSRETAFLSRSPEWWSRYFKHSTFFGAYSPEEMKLYKSICLDARNLGSGGSIMVMLYPPLEL